MEKRKNFSAVASIMMLLCVVVLGSCNKYDTLGIEPKPEQPAQVEKLACEVIMNGYSGNGVISTRSTTSSDGVFTATSKHLMTFAYGTEKLQRDYVGTNEVEAYRVSRQRYASKIDIFGKASFIENKPLSDGRTSYTVRFDDAGNDFDFDLVETQRYDTDTVIVMGESFTKCKNSFIERKLAGTPEITDLQRDSADWKAYKVRIPFEYTLEMGENNGSKFYVTINPLWVAKAGTTPDIPDDEYETVSFESKDKKFEYVNDTTSRSSFTLVRFLSNGERIDGETISVLLKNKLVAPDYQEKEVSNFDWEKGSPSVASAIKNGELYEKEENIFVQPYKQTYTTRTNKCDAMYVANYEGSAYYVDSLGKAHTFLEKDWSFAEIENKEWEDKELEASTEYERLLLTSNIVGKFNEHNHSRKAEVELKAKKGSAADIVKYEYDNFGIKEIEQNKKYYTYCIQHAVYSDETKEKVDTIGVNIFMSVDTPEKQFIDVQDFEINDLEAKPSNAIREDSRNYKDFQIQKYYQKYTTKTNKSECVFTAHYEKDVVYVDRFGKEVELKGISPKFADKGGNLTDLEEQDSKERKLLTSTISIACNGNSSSDYQGEVEFRKVIAKEELLSWDKKQELKYKGNGVWTSTTIVTYNYKIAGENTETYTQDLIWNISGEDKKQVILTSASADYKTMKMGTEQSESATNGNITVVTKTKTITEDYTNLSDIYTQTTQTASYKAEVMGKEISFDFLAPSSMVVASNGATLVEANQITEVNGALYNVHNHKGSVTATVDNETLTATVEKDILVAKTVDPFNPSLGNVVKLVSTTLCYRPGVGENGQGAFHKCMVIDFENGKVVAVTKSYGPDAYDFEPVAYIYGEGVLESNYKINSAALFDGKWVPALITMDGTGWKYATVDGKVVEMDQELAILANIKNFTGQSTAANNPYLNYSGTVSESNVLTVRNHLGAVIFSIK